MEMCSEQAGIVEVSRKSSLIPSRGDDSTRGWNMEVDRQQQRLINWGDLQKSEMERQPYGVLDVRSGTAGNGNNLFVESIAIVEAYTRGIEWSKEMCQEYNFIGSREKGSIVCEQCLPSARYAVFSVNDSAYTKQIHVHDNRLAKCLSCDKRIKAKCVKLCRKMPEMSVCIRVVS